MTVAPSEESKGILTLLLMMVNFINRNEKKKALAHNTLLDNSSKDTNLSNLTVIVIIPD